MKTRILPLLALISLLPACSSLQKPPAADQVKLTSLPDRVHVEIAGQPFTDYVFGDGASRSYCYPILAADGTPLTRDFPQKETPGEDHDHKWHRSFWFAHSFVNGVDFWNEAGGDVGKSPPNKGHTELSSIDTKSGSVGVIRTSNRWVAPDGRLICTDERTVSFHAIPDGRIIDFEITLHALPTEPLLMGDNKDGTMAVRLAQWMTLPHKVTQPDKTVNDNGGAGHIVTAKGDLDKDAWGKRADWCDYHAERNGKTYGVAIFDHPQNLRHPTWWMARDYGLFGANPFGQHDYENLKDQPHIGDYTIPAGGILTLRYRFLFHEGDEKAAHVGVHYAEYASNLHL